ncbi:MAG: TonB-dependent receptor [Rhodobacteraceae bacterium]|nr:TonB-dependent receptor [Paracoccaceae bacterium]
MLTKLNSRPIFTATVAAITLAVPGLAWSEGQTAVSLTGLDAEAVADAGQARISTQGGSPEKGPGKTVMKADKPGEKKPVAPQTRAIYDPAGGRKGRNVARLDMPLCSNWQGGPKGTLLPAGAGDGPLPRPGQHGMIALGFSEACERGEGLLKFSSRGESFFAEGTIHTEDIGTYTAPDGTRVVNDRDRQTYKIAAGWIGEDGSFLSFATRRMQRDKILFQGVGPGSDTRKFDVEGYDLVGKIMLDGDLASQLRFKISHNQIDKITDNFTYRPVSGQKAKTILDGTSANAMAAIDGGGAGFKWTLGFDYDLDQRNADKFRGAALAPYSTDFADAKIAVTGLTADGTWTLGAGRRLLAGLRVEHVDASLDDMDRSFATPTPRQLLQDTYGYTGNGKTTETNFAAKLRFEQDLSGNRSQWFAGLSYTPRTADPRERYFTGYSGDPLKMWIGNPDLDPERHLMLELGGGMRSGPWTLASRAYADWAEDFIIGDRARGQAGILVDDDRNIYRNVDAFIGGLEGSAIYEWKNGFYAGAEIWLTYGQNTTDNRAIAQIPPAEAALKLGWKGEQVSLGGTWHLVSSQPRLDDDIFTGSGSDGDGYGGALGAGYGTLDLAANWTPRKDMTFGVGIENVFDKTYVPLIERGDTDNPFLFNPTAPGRSLWAKAIIRF